jgi:hypothetical protein
MKNIKIFIAIIIAISFSACNDEFMEQIPQTNLTVEGFFKSTNDLQSYVYGLYRDEQLFPRPPYDDLSSDNVAVKTDHELFQSILTGLRTPQNASGWDGWGSLRSVNVMLTNLDNVTGTEADINHYVGIARYMRAWFYIQKVQTYSDVPWVDRPLSTDDEALYDTQTPRAEVVQHIIEDLEFASNNIKEDLGNKTIITKWAALALTSRFCLYEGTYRKYHSELGLTSSANDFLQRSITASEALMNSGNFSISGYGTTDLGNGMIGALGYRDLFVSKSLSDNSEVILWREYDIDKTYGMNQSDDMMDDRGRTYSLNRSLQESYLTKDGKPFSTVKDYNKKKFDEVFVDRDPRMCEMISYPGVYDEIPGVSQFYHHTTPYRGGYDQVKYFPRTATREWKGNRDGLGQFNAILMYRLGEILLNYAEAKAELGQWSADVANRTVNILRDRVSMPHFDAEREYDATLQSLYPNITDKTILALRRERRVELAGEGFRYQDVQRWAAGKVYELTISKQGAYVPQVPYIYETTGGKAPELAYYGIVQNEASVPSFSGSITWIYLDGNEYFYIDSEGFIRNNNDDSRRFEEPKCYYRPIPIQQMVLNPNLKQPYGW